MGRKGLNKFFDLAVEFVDPDSRNNDRKFNTKQIAVKNYILGTTLKSILGGYQIEVLKTLKANGENA
jgi:hypothetical protein